jgi:hypothetical protein
METAWCYGKRNSIVAATPGQEEPYVRQGLCLALADCVAWASDADKQVGGHRRVNATNRV